MIVCAYFLFPCCRLVSLPFSFFFFVFVRTRWWTCCPCINERRNTERNEISRRDWQAMESSEADRSEFFFSHSLFPFFSTLILFFICFLLPLCYSEFRLIDQKEFPFTLNPLSSSSNETKQWKPQGQRHQHRYHHQHHPYSEHDNRISCFCIHWTTAWGYLFLWLEEEHQQSTLSCTLLPILILKTGASSSNADASATSSATSIVIDWQHWWPFLCLDSERHSISSLLTRTRCPICLLLNVSSSSLSNFI